MSQRPRANALRETVEADETALGVVDTAYSPTLVELYGNLGMDFVWIDLEHAGPSPWDAEALEELLRAAEAGDTELLVRVPSADPAMIRKALDAGVRSLFVSRVETAAEARRAVEASRFRYDDGAGQRGLANPRARRWGLVDDYPEREDESVLIGVTVETEAAVENVDDILAVPDLGFAFAGPLDLSVAAGSPGDVDSPEVEAAVETIEDACERHDVPLGGLGFGTDDVNEKAARGYRIVNVGSTAGALTTAVTGWLDDFESA